MTTGRVVAAGDGLMFLELEPLTGRMHQLRVQAAVRTARERNGFKAGLR